MGCHQSNNRANNPSTPIKAIGERELSQSQQKNLTKQKSSRLARKGVSLAQKFSSLLVADHVEYVDGMDRTTLEKALADAGIRISSNLYNMLFYLLDVNNDGLINRREFIVCLAILLNSDHEKEQRNELTFKLFDGNKSGEISRWEFNEIYAILLGTKLSYVLDLELGRKALMKFLNAEHCSESLEFINAVVDYETNAVEGMNTLEEAENIMKTFVVVDSEKEVNISNDMRNSIEMTIFQAKERNQLNIEANVFEIAKAEVIRLVEDGKFSRFKTKLASDPTFFDFSQSIWEQYAIKGCMTKEHYNEWAKDFPETFKFFDDLKQSLQQEDSMFTSGESLEVVSRKLFYIDGRVEISHDLLATFINMVHQEVISQEMRQVTLDEWKLHAINCHVPQHIVNAESFTTLFHICVRKDSSKVSVLQLITSTALHLNKGNEKDSLLLLFRLFDFTGNQILSEAEAMMLMYCILDFENLLNLIVFKPCSQAIQKYLIGIDPRNDGVVTFLQRIETTLHYASVREEVINMESFRALEPEIKQFVKSPNKTVRQETQVLLDALTNNITSVASFKRLLNQSRSSVLKELDMKPLQDLSNKVETEKRWPDFDSLFWGEVERKREEMSSVEEKESEQFGEQLLLKEYQYLMKERYSRTFQHHVLNKLEELQSVEHIDVMTVY